MFVNFEFSFDAGLTDRVVIWFCCLLIICCFYILFLAVYCLLCWFCFVLNLYVLFNFGVFDVFLMLWIWFDDSFDVVVLFICFCFEAVFVVCGWIGYFLMCFYYWLFGRLWFWLFIVYFYTLIWYIHAVLFTLFWFVYLLTCCVL